MELSDNIHFTSQALDGITKEKFLSSEMQVLYENIPPSPLLGIFWLHGFIHPFKFLFRVLEKNEVGSLKSVKNAHKAIS